MADWGSFGMGQLSQFSDLVWNMIGKSIGGLIDNMWFGDYNRKRQFEFATNLLDYENAYNTPEAQMQRLSAAGLNPNLVYGSQAPAGVSGNATTPPPSTPSSYNTSDLSLAMLQAKELQRLDQEKEVLASQAAKNNAEARFTNQQSDRYNELIDTQLREASVRMEEAASRMNLNSSDVQLKAAQTSLATAEEAYRRGEIGLQQFRKAEIIAQTNLYRSEESLNRTKDYYLDIQGQMDVLELDYKKLFYAGDNMKNLTQAEYDHAIKQFKYEAAKAGSLIGIHGNDAANWTDWIFGQFSRLFGGAASGSVSTGMRMSNTHTPVKPL